MPQDDIPEPAAEPETRPNSTARDDLKRRRAGAAALAQAVKPLAQVVEHHITRAALRRELAGRGRKVVRPSAPADEEPAAVEDDQDVDGAVLLLRKLKAAGIETPPIAEPRGAWYEARREEFRAIDEATARAV